MAHCAGGEEDGSEAQQIWTPSPHRGAKQTTASPLPMRGQRTMRNTTTGPSNVRMLSGPETQELTDEENNVIPAVCCWMTRG